MSSANSLSLGQFKMLSFGKRFNSLYLQSIASYISGITEESELQKITSQPDKQRSDLETKEFGQQTDFPATPTSADLTSVERREDRKRQFVTSHKFLNETPGQTPQHPFEKTVFYVKSPTGNITKRSDPDIVPEKAERPVSASRVNKSNRIDSGYGSRPETIRIPGTPNKPYSGKSVTISEFGSESPVRTSTVHEGVKSSVQENKQGSKLSTMSYYATEIYSPTSSARRQEKQDLQLLNDRFSNYIQRVRLLSEQSNRLDASSFVKQTRILEEEVANLKTLYERELDVLRYMIVFLNYCLTLCHTILIFNDLEIKSLLKTLWEKEKMLVNSIISFSHNVFYPSQNRFQFFNHIYFCRLQML